jgi:hypothetical protein
MIMISSQDTMSLVEKCLQMKEDRILRCGNNEPWGYSIICAAKELLAVHLGEKTPLVAKAAAAERFVNLHLKLLAGQDPPASTQQSERQPMLSQPLLPPPSQSMPSSAFNPLAALSAQQDMSGLRSKVRVFKPGYLSSYVFADMCIFRCCIVCNTLSGIARVCYAGRKWTDRGARNTVVGP